jgi:hypothetical protein
MTGFAARPGTDVEPECSTRSARSTAGYSSRCHEPAIRPTSVAADRLLRQRLPHATSAPPVLRYLSGSAGAAPRRLPHAASARRVSGTLPTA